MSDLSHFHCIKSQHQYRIAYLDVSLFRVLFTWVHAIAFYCFPSQRVHGTGWFVAEPGTKFEAVSESRTRHAGEAGERALPARRPDNGWFVAEPESKFEAVSLSRANYTGEAGERASLFRREDSAPHTYERGVPFEAVPLSRADYAGAAPLGEHSRCIQAAQGFKNHARQDCMS